MADRILKSQEDDDATTAGLLTLNKDLDDKNPDLMTKMRRIKSS